MWNLLTAYFAVKFTVNLGWIFNNVYFNRISSSAVSEITDSLSNQDVKNIKNMQIIIIIKIIMS